MAQRGRVPGEGYWKDVYTTEFGSETGGSSAVHVAYISVTSEARRDHRNEMNARGRRPWMTRRTHGLLEQSHRSREQSTTDTPP